MSMQSGVGPHKKTQRVPAPNSHGQTGVKNVTDIGGTNKDSD